MAAEGGSVAAQFFDQTGAFTQRVFAFGLVVAMASTVLVKGTRHSPAEIPLLRWPRIVFKLPSPPRFVDELDVTEFQRGNVHTHTRNSDGDSPPPVVYSWYRDHGYQWLAITDHNTRTNPAIYKLLERKGQFVMIGAEEVTMHGAGKQVHVNAICTKKTIGGHRDNTVAGALAWAVAKVHAQGGVALVNHPNWDWALRATDLQGARGAEMLEIFSGHPFVHQDGDAEHPSHEQLWDTALSAGFAFGGAAVDDAHDFAEGGRVRPSRPGRGWIQVFAPTADRALICEALAKRRYYSSSGPALTRIAVKGATFTVWPADPAASVEFIGKGGVLLRKASASSDGARYTLQSRETYVRARVTDPDGKQAWTNAYFTNG